MTSRTKTFNASTDWGTPVDGNYSIAFAHNLNSPDVFVQLWDETGTPINTLAAVQRSDTNTVSISVNHSPDERFAGRLVVIGAPVPNGMPPNDMGWYDL